MSENYIAHTYSPFYAAGKSGLAPNPQPGGPNFSFDPMRFIR